MKRYVGAAAFFFILATGLSYSAERETLEQLIARADSAPEGQRADLHLEIAEREVKVAADAYAAGKSADANAALQQLVSSADKAHAMALKHGKKLPRTEIKIRRVAGRLRDLKRNVDADDQPTVQNAVDKLESFRTELLKGMFGTKGPEKQ